jgi:hypothetical protein
MKFMDAEKFNVRPYCLILGVLVAGSCSPRLDKDILSRVKNRSEIDQSVEQWTIHSDRADVRNAALSTLLVCAQDNSAGDESRAYCLSALNNLSGKSDDVLEKIDGLVLPTRVVKLSRIFMEMSAR